MFARKEAALALHFDSPLKKPLLQLIALLRIIVVPADQNNLCTAELAQVIEQTVSDGFEIGSCNGKFQMVPEGCNRFCVRRDSVREMDSFRHGELGILLYEP